MSKYNRNEAEPYVAGSLIAAESLLDEARDNAFSAPSISVTDCRLFSGKPQAVDIDRDKDGKADATATISYSMFGYIDRIDVTGKGGSKEYSIQFDRTLGVVNHAKLDLKADGATDARFAPDYAWFSTKVHGLSIDTNNDNKAEQQLSFNRGWWTGDVYRAGMDKNNDGKIDNYYDLKRHWLSGNLNQLERRKGN
ncbi:MAG: hypothetical protein IT342_27240 [Candidatus Melainabacteria bacterium]|nr:hypothetical protein [Candidatus Melainabacteria bacterium]